MISDERKATAVCSPPSRAPISPAEMSGPGEVDEVSTHLTPSATQVNLVWKSYSTNL
jgi:hypothetical protein